MVLLLVAYLLIKILIIGPYDRSEVSLYTYEKIKERTSEFPILKNKYNSFIQDGQISRYEDRQLQSYYKELKLKKVKEDIQ